MHIELTPQDVKTIKDKKTDKRDAKWIANMLRFDIAKASFIPSAGIRILCELSHYRLKLSYMGTEEKNVIRTAWPFSSFGSTAYWQTLSGFLSYDHELPAFQWTLW